MTSHCGHCPVGSGCPAAPVTCEAIRGNPEKTALFLSLVAERQPSALGVSAEEADAIIAQTEEAMRLYPRGDGCGC